MKQKLWKRILASNLIVLCVLLTGCVEEPPMVIENEDIPIVRDYSVEIAEQLVANTLKQTNKTCSYFYDSEVVFNDYTDMYWGKYYKFNLIENEEVLDNYLLVNKQTGVILSCYLDGSYEQIKDDSNYNDSAMWQGHYYKKLDDSFPENSYTIISIAQEDDYNLHITTNSFFGAGEYKMVMDCLIDGNDAVFENEYMTVKFVLNEDNTIQCTVLDGDEDVVNALDGLLV